MPSPAIAREFSLAYAGVTIGGTSAYYLLDAGDEGWTVDGTYERTRVACDVTVVTPAGTEAEFVAKCQALEVAFRTINGAIVVTLGSTTWLSLQASDNTGFLARPSFRVVNSQKNTGRSRLYRVEVIVQRPSDFAGNNGLQSAQIRVTKPTSGGPRIVSIVGTYTAQSGPVAADAQFYARIGALIDSVTANINTATSTSNPWEKTVQEPVYDDQNKIVRFTAAAVEVTFRQSQGNIDEPAIKNQVLVVDVARPAPGDLVDATRPQEVTVAYDVDIDSAVTTSLASYWTATILPWLIQHVKNVTGGSLVALVRPTPRFDYPRNRISASLTFHVVKGTTTLMHSRRTRIVTASGKVVSEVMDGNPWAAEVFDGPGRRVRITTDDLLVVGGSGSADSGSAGGASGGGGTLRDAFFQEGGVDDVTLAGDTLKDSFHAEGSPEVTFGTSGGGSSGASFGGSGGGSSSGGQSTGKGKWVRLVDDITSDPTIVGVIEARFPVIHTTKIITERYVEKPSSRDTVSTGGGGSDGVKTGLRGEL